LTLLADLGEKGKTTALEIFDLKHETTQELRDIFLEYFYSPAIWEQNPGNFNFDDYLCLMRHRHPIHFPNHRTSGEKTRQFLYTIATTLPGADTGITDTNKLAEIYDKLKLFAYLGSPGLNTKALDLFKRAFDPEKTLDIILTCKNFDDRVWLLEQYFLHIKDIAVPDLHWWKLTYD
jgi:hypothetical protein